MQKTSSISTKTEIKPYMACHCNADVRLLRSIRQDCDPWSHPKYKHWDGDIIYPVIW